MIDFREGGIENEQPAIFEPSVIPNSEGPLINTKLDPGNFFTENRGQWSEILLFKGNTQFGSVGFTSDSVLFDFIGEKTGHVIEYRFIGANLIKPLGEDLCSHYHNYFLGNDNDRWTSNVQNFKKVKYENLWDDIDLIFYFNEDGLKYDFIVKPGGDHNAIKVQILGQKGLEVRENKLRLKYGDEREFVQEKPITFYKDEEKLIPSELIVNNEIISFKMGEYDSTREIIIDPLLYSTYIGGSSEDYPRKVTIYNDDIIGTGYCRGSNFPTTPGAYQRNHIGGIDIVVFSFNSTGLNMNFATYIGGSGSEQGFGIATDNVGSIFIGGYSRSSNFPITSNAYSSTFRGIPGDAYILKLNASGSKLDYSTFISGREMESVEDICVDSNGNAIIGGYTYSSDFPITPNGFDTTYNGDQEGFLVKINHNGSGLLYSSFIGGSNSDRVYGIDIDDEDNTYLTGYTGFVSGTNPNLLPTTQGAYDTTHNGYHDVFVLRMNNSGSKLDFSTYIGGSTDEYSYDIAVDRDRYVYVAGVAFQSDFPTTSNAYDNTYNGNRDVFVSKFLSNGTDLVYSTFIGGSNSDYGYGVSVNNYGEAFITGVAHGDFPTTENAFDKVEQNGDAIACRLNSNGTELIFSTFIGGENGELCFDIKNIGNNSWIFGYSQGSGYPTTNNAYDTTHNGGFDFILSEILMANEPDSPMNLSGYVNQSGAILSWEEPNYSGGDEIIGYKIYRGSSTNLTSLIATIGKGENYIDGNFTHGKGFFYNITAINSVGVSNSSNHYYVIDNEKPTFIEDSTESSGTTGEDLRFHFTVKDNVGIQSAFINYWFRNETPVRLPLIPLDLESGAWYGNISLPEDRIDPIFYNATFADPTSNTLILDHKRIDILDNDKPKLDQPPFFPDAYTNETYEISFNILDNVEIALAWVEIEQAGGFHYNVSLVESSGLWKGEFHVENSTGSMGWLLHVLDSSGNGMIEGGHINVCDREPPIWIGEVFADDPTTGDNCSFIIQIADNVRIGGAWLEFWYDDNNSSNVSMSETDNDNWTVTIGIIDSPPGEGFIHYRYHFKDTSNNWVHSRIFESFIRDNDPPIIIDESDEIATTGDPFHFSFRITDNSEITSVRVEWDFDYFDPYPYFPFFNPVTLIDGRAEYSIMIPKSGYWSFAYKLTVWGSTGSEYRTGMVIVEIFDNDAPIFLDLDPEISALGTGEKVTLSVNVTDNTYMSNVKLEYWFGSEKKEVEMEEEYGKYWINNITIPTDSLKPFNYRYIAMDNFDNMNTTADLSIPVIDSIKPWIRPMENISVKKGDIIDITPEVDDNIGVNRIQWNGTPILPTQGKLLGLLNEPGEYLVTVTVFDEQGNSNSTTFTLTVLSEEEEGLIEGGNILWIILLIVAFMIIAGGILYFAVFRRRSRGVGSEKEALENERTVIPAGPKDETYLPKQRGLPPEKRPGLKDKADVISPSGPATYRSADEMPKAPKPVKGDQYISPRRSDINSGKKTKVKGELGPKETNMLYPKRD